MTDEEKLAEEMICSECSDDVNRSYTHCSACTRCDDFIKGLAEGRKEKWHDLRKDPNDLPPKEDINSSYSIDVFTDTEAKAFYSYYDGVWRRESDGFRIPEVIAWTELPKFKE